MTTLDNSSFTLNNPNNQLITCDNLGVSVPLGVKLLPNKFSEKRMIAMKITVLALQLK